MSAPNASLLNGGQIAKRVFDESIGAVRIIPSEGTEFSIELSASDGDSVQTQSVQSAQSAAIAHANTGVVIAAFSVVGLTKVALYTATTSTIVGSQVCTLEVSPSDSSNVWIATSATITPNLTNGVVVYTAPVTISARRARVSIAAAITSGTFDLYAIASA